MAASGSTEEQGTRRSIYAAFIANLLIAISKFIAGFISGSSAMLAEGAHSVADTTNQIFLIISLRTSKSVPDEKHPYGYGQDRFFWSCLVAVGLFVAGAVFSIYEDVAALIGLVIAFAGLYLTQTTGNHLYDGLASIVIGAVLIAVDWELGIHSRALLIGEAVPPRTDGACMRPQPPSPK